ncbi:hypothetical protein C8R45DRAFT_1214769 [Mycena sanguinolenta]|nr:hypothetical protein C8R45DRAFT_1214769 [Mycena sanguinolenta]
MSRDCGTDLALDSPFREHLNTKYVPTDAEMERIRAHLAPHEAELVRLDRLIESLAAQRGRIKSYVEPHRALISHPRRLPQDIVEEIFLHCLPRKNAVMSVREVPLLLGRVCSAWRSIAFSMPRLWTSVHIPIAFITSSEMKQTAMIEWLERSAPFPVALSLVGVSGSRGAPSNHPDIPVALLGFSPRWEVLHVSEMPLDILSKIVDVAAPRLTEIRITFADTISYMRPDQRQPHFLSSTLFRTMKPGRIILSGSELNNILPKQPFTWDHITDLALESGSPHTLSTAHIDTRAVYRLMKGCKNLVSLSVAVTGSEEARPWPHEIHIADSLNCLAFVDLRASLQEVMDLVDRLLMPNLRRFVVVPRRSSPNLTWEFPERFVANTPFLSDLRIIDDFMELPHLLATLQRFPHLTKLCLSSDPGRSPAKPWNATNLLARLSPSPDIPILLPQLKELDIQDSGRLDDATLLCFIERQLEYETNLRIVRVSLSGDRPPVVPDLTSFRCRGLDVSVNYFKLWSPRPTASDGVLRFW